MTVEKFIRILGYIIYVALWSPVIILGIIVLPIWFAIKLRSIKAAIRVTKHCLDIGLAHDMEFIKTGVWS